MKKLILLFFIGILSSCSADIVDLGDMNIDQKISSEQSILWDTDALEYEPRENANWTVATKETWITFASNKGEAKANISVNIDIKSKVDEGIFTITYSNGTIENIKVKRESSDKVIPSKKSILWDVDTFEYTPRESSDWVVTTKDTWITFTADKGVSKSLITVNIDINTDAKDGQFTIAYNNGTVETVDIKIIKKDEVEPPVVDRPSRDVVVMQINVWQEGTTVSGGYNAIVNEISHHNPDFITLSEVRNYGGVDFTAKLIEDLAKKGKVYYSQRSDDTGLLSKYPISSFETIFPLANDCGSIYKLISEVDGVKFAVYTAHLDYKNYASFLPRGYDGASFQPIAAPVVDLKAIKEQNLKSMRDDAIKLFIADAKKENEAGSIVIVGGDFNEPSHLDWTVETKDLYDHNGVVYHWDVSMMLQNAGYIDSYRELYKSAVTHPGFTYPSDNVDIDNVGQLSWAPKADERDRIDFIYYYPNIKLSLLNSNVYGPSGSVVKHKRIVEPGEDTFISPLDVWPTDHKGLISTFKLYLD